MFYIGDLVLGGGIIERDTNGTPTGILTDQAMDLINNVIPESPRNYVEAITKWVGDLSAEGITTIKDPEIYQELVHSNLIRFLRIVFHAKFHQS